MMLGLEEAGTGGGVMPQATVSSPSARRAGDGERLARKSAYDFVVVGGGPNGLGISAYLSKWGFSVCVLEARPEIGGGAENTEPEPGFSIDPHASFFYGTAAPAMEQLELGRYGFRLSPSSGSVSIASDGRHVSQSTGNYQNAEAFDPVAFVESFGAPPDGAKFYVEFMTNLQGRLQEFLRSIYWTPPYDHRWRVPREELPETKIFKEIVPIWDDAFLEMSLYEFFRYMDLPDPLLCSGLINAWGNGPHPYYKGMLIPAFGVGQLLGFAGSPSPVGGMHALAHALARCALAHDARIFVNAPVTEVIVRDGRAVGVRVDDESALEEKTVWANLGVIFNNHVKNLPEICTSGAFTPDLVSRIGDLSLKGGSLWVMNMLVNELPQLTVAPELNQPGTELTVMVLNSDTPKLMELMRDVQTFRTHPTDLDHYGGLWFITQGAHDRTRVRGGDRHVIYFNLQVPAPEDHRDGPEAVNRARDEIVDNVKTIIRSYAPNMTDDKYDKIWVNSPYDSSLRNMAFVGGQWMGIRESDDAWGPNKPLPELARYRTPVDGLYLCHQTSHPGGLCLIAVPYNLMHMLHEDYPEVSSTTPDWWYPSPWHITDQEGGTA
jgi:beta-carotene ketolase (CrtO type)